MFTGQDCLIKEERSCYPSVQGQGTFPWYLFPFCKKCLLKLSPSQWVRTFAHWSVKVYLDGWAPCGTEKEGREHSEWERPLHVHAFLGEELWQHCTSYIPLLLWTVRTELTWQCAVFTLTRYSSPKKSQLSVKPPFECCHLSLSYA